jgi:hypothetical protein
MEAQDMRACQRCGGRYDWKRSSSSSLKMTYCSMLCEKGALGFTLDTVLNGIRILRREWQPLLVA